MAEDTKGLTLYLSPAKKDEIEKYFLLKCGIKNFSEGYREIVRLGFEEFKKIKRK